MDVRITYPAVAFGLYDLPVEIAVSLRVVAAAGGAHASSGAVVVVAVVFVVIVVVVSAPATTVGSGALRTAVAAVCVGHSDAVAAGVWRASSARSGGCGGRGAAYDGSGGSAGRVVALCLVFAEDSFALLAFEV